MSECTTIFTYSGIIQLSCLFIFISFCRPLKTFRMKKRSSELGVNMTSESPPPLRRDIISYNQEDEHKYALHDPHFRNTLTLGGRGGGGGSDAFQRNAIYRSSLQNMSTANELSFNRHNRYRSTVQNGTQLRNSDGRYVYSGSITPTPKGRYLTDNSSRMTPG